MSRIATRLVSRPVRLVGLAGLVAAAVMLTQLLGSPAAHAQPGPSLIPQPIIVPGALNISTNQMAYTVGSWARVCYQVPAPGYIQITDHQGGTVKTLKAGYDDGTGDCFWGQVTPPAGTECLRIQYFYPYGGSTARHTCFQVLGSYPYPYPFPF